MIRRQVVIPASTEGLWEALTNPDLLRGWFGGLFDWELNEGSPLRFEGDDGVTREGRIDAVREARHLRFTWWPVGEPGDASEVSYLVEPDKHGARLTVQERPLGTPSRGDSPRACASEPDRGTWTHWDTRLVGAWAGVAAGAIPAGPSANPSLSARA